MTNKRCGNCKLLDRASETDIGGLRIAKCTHPIGVTVQTTFIKNDYVDLDERCSEYIHRASVAKARR
jgi:hypothetical protein